MAKRPKRIKKDIKEDLGGLTPPSDLVQETAAITGQDVEPEESKVIIKKVGGRPVDPKKSLRKKYTTMIDPHLTTRMKIQALREDMTTADLLEKIIIAYLAKNEKK